MIYNVSSIVEIWYCGMAPLMIVTKYTEWWRFAVFSGALHMPSGTVAPLSLECVIKSTRVKRDFFKRDFRLSGTFGWAFKIWLANRALLPGLPEV